MQVILLLESEIQSFVMLKIVPSFVSGTSVNLFVDPGGGGRLPADQLLGLEPEGDLGVGALDGIGTVADVAADFD